MNTDKPSEVDENIGGSFTFLTDKDHESWVMKIDDKGIKFNREKFSKCIDILERKFEVKFYRKSNDSSKNPSGS